MKAETVVRGPAVLAFCLWAGMASAEDRAGDFTHYVLALSWNASWCALEGEGEGALKVGTKDQAAWNLR